MLLDNSGQKGKMLSGELEGKIYSLMDMNGGGN